MTGETEQQKVQAARAAGDLTRLVEVCTQWVKAKPALVPPRLALAEALVLMGALERADTQLDIAATQDPAQAVRLALLRQLIRAEQARRDVIACKAVPELLLEPDDSVRASLARLVDLESGQAATAADDIPQSFLNGGQDAQDFRDLDDRFAQIAEVLSSTGKYFWVPVTAIRSAQFRPVESVFDMIWRPCDMEISGGPEGVVFWPMLYPPADGISDALRLGRETQWYERHGLTLGLGRRRFLAGDDVVSGLELDSLAMVEAQAA